MVFLVLWYLGNHCLVLFAEVKMVFDHQCHQRYQFGLLDTLTWEVGFDSLNLTWEVGLEYLNLKSKLFVVDVLLNLAALRDILDP